MSVSLVGLLSFVDNFDHYFGYIFFHCPFISCNIPADSNLYFTMFGVPGSTSLFTEGMRIEIAVDVIKVPCALFNRPITH